MSARESLDRRQVERCYRSARAERWALPLDAFAAALSTSAHRAFPDSTPTARQLDSYLRSLHLEDLALASACAEGIESAWDHFVLEYRPVLYRAADVTGNSARGREVADSLYGELFGLALRDGERRSHFRYFHGRSSLATWLRAVFSQRYVDAIRSTARSAPLPGDDAADAIVDTRPVPRSGTTMRALELLQRLIAAAVATLATRDRLRLRCYYAQDLTLAQIGQLLGEHEATVSRNLSRARRIIRQEVERRLRDEHHFSAGEIAECFASATADAGPLDLNELLRTEPDEPAPRKEVVQDRSSKEGLM